MNELKPRLPVPVASQATEGALELFRAALTDRRRTSISHVRGATRGWVIAHGIRPEWGPVIAVTADEESADSLAADLAFFLGGAGTRSAPRVLR
jgi:hypothetical protein